ncbi:MAG: Acid phosphatase/vanadium-dependent haloperoxidase related protein [Parcubacteria group bacterium GW2011_GWC2_38_7]|nr:MAG: Acid phosphatase/vanadium-dependent haloperoxidase related protein [Parcubacteria group bacterium GW2011_GWC2_38_7]
MSYSFLLVPIVSALLAQIIKMIINAKKGQFSWDEFNSYGGMPSSHAALVISLAAMAGYFEGWNSFAFAFAFILALIVIRDAGGFRRVLGYHAEELNNIIHTLKPTEGYKYPHLNEIIGHTPLQLFAGSLLGIAVTVLYIIIF